MQISSLYCLCQYGLEFNKFNLVGLVFCVTLSVSHVMILAHSSLQCCFCCLGFVRICSCTAIEIWTLTGPLQSCGLIRCKFANLSMLPCSFHSHTWSVFFQRPTEFEVQLFCFVFLFSFLYIWHWTWIYWGIHPCDDYSTVLTHSWILQTGKFPKCSFY